ncbi:MAG: RQC domain-containing protein, partial [Bacteroidota bacterium]
FYDFHDIVKLEKFMKDKPVSERESGRHLLYEMASFAESGACRRKLMLHYFGETFDDSNCEKMCDNCRHPKTSYDATPYVDMVLEAVQAVNEKFGTTHLIAVLRSSNNQQVNLYGHEKLPVYGKGKDLNEGQWKAVFAQMIINDFLIKDIEDYGVIKLGTAAADYLSNPRKVTFVEFQDYAKLNKETPAVEDFQTYDTRLFESLKKLRKKVAQDKGVPPYVIFQEPSLEDMASKYPVSIDEFQNIVGVGRGKAQKFAAPFVKLIKEYVDAHNIERMADVVVKSTARKSMNKLFIIQHVDRRTPLDQIADLKGMEYEDLLAQVEQIVYSGTKLNLDYYIESVVDEDKIDEIYDYFMQSETDSLAVAEQSLDEDITPEEIQLVRIKFISQEAN